MRKWIRRFFIAWAVFSTAWLLNSFRTQGVDEKFLKSTPAVTVRDGDASLDFTPKAPKKTGLIFLCGGGVAAPAYAPLLRPVAESGYEVVIVKLPYRLAPLDSHKLTALDRVRETIAKHSQIEQWIIAGHSLGAALACRAARQHESIVGMALVGTTHPKEDDLSQLKFPVTKVYGSRDGVAQVADIEANQPLLPTHTRYMRIEGANHSQFGHYGHQILDGRATIDRDEQQKLTCEAILEMLGAAESNRPESR